MNEHIFNNTVYRFYYKFIKVKFNHFKYCEEQINKVIELKAKEKLLTEKIPFKLHYKFKDLVIDVVGYNDSGFFFFNKDIVIKHFYNTYSNWGIFRNRNDFYNYVKDKIKLYKYTTKEQLENYLYINFCQIQLIKNIIKD